MTRYFEYTHRAVELRSGMFYDWLIRPDDTEEIIFDATNHEYRAISVYKSMILATLMLVPVAHPFLEEVVGLGTQYETRKAYHRPAWGCYCTRASEYEQPIRAAPSERNTSNGGTSRGYANGSIWGSGSGAGYATDTARSTDNTCGHIYDYIDDFDWGTKPN